MHFYPTGQFSFFQQLQPLVPEIVREGRKVLQNMEWMAFAQPGLFRNDPLLQQGSRARFMLTLAGYPLLANQRRCPSASSALLQVPGLVSAGYYLLGPNSHIKPHHGAREQFLRVHLGVVIPAGCAIRVEQETRPWVEGEFLVFDDAYEHEAWNQSSSYRCVFHFDFFHGVAEEEQAGRLQDLGRRVVEAAPHYHAQFLAAEVQAPEEQLQSMRATSQSISPAGLTALKNSIDGYGLYLGY